MKRTVGNVRHDTPNAVYTMRHLSSHLQMARIGVRIIMGPGCMYAYMCARVSLVISRRWATEMPDDRSKPSAQLLRLPLSAPILLTSQHLTPDGRCDADDAGHVIMQQETGRAAHIPLSKHQCRMNKSDCIVDAIGMLRETLGEDLNWSEMMLISLVFGLLLGLEASKVDDQLIEDQLVEDQLVKGQLVAHYSPCTNV